MKKQVADEDVTSMVNPLSVREWLVSLKRVSALLIVRVAGVFVFDDWMMRVNRDDDPALVNALAVCVPDDNTIVVPVVNFVELYAAPSVEQGDDDNPHEVDVDPPVVFT